MKKFHYNTSSKKLLIILTAFVLVHSLAFSQDTGFSINDNGDFFHNGKKIGKVAKTANSNFMTGTIPEFTVYDVNGVPRFLFERNEGKFIFLDDNKSFLPRKVDAYAKQVASFFASDSILTPRGYNVAYRSAFIKKHNGVNLSETSSRDFNAPVRYIENNILQGDALIGRYEYRLMDNGKDTRIAVYDLNNKAVAFITTTKDNSVAYYDMKILNANQSVVKVFEKEFETGQLYKKGIEWIVKNGFLGSDQKTTEKKISMPNETVKEPTVRVIKDPSPERTEALRKAAFENDIEAQFNLFKSLYPPDDERLMWLKRASENGHAEAQYQLGELYYNGPDFFYAKIRGIPQDFGEALKWYKKSAEQGFAEAQWELGVFYQIGRGVLKEDCEESLKWLLKAASQGNNLTRQFAIAEMYEKGYMYERCVKKNKEEAIVWYKKAAQHKGPTDTRGVWAREKLDKWKVKYEK